MGKAGAWHHPGWHKFSFGPGARNFSNSGLTCRLLEFCNKDAHLLFGERNTVILYFTLYEDGLILRGRPQFARLASVSLN